MIAIILTVLCLFWLIEPTFTPLICLVVVLRLGRIFIENLRFWHTILLFSIRFNQGCDARVLMFTKAVFRTALENHVSFLFIWYWRWGRYNLHMAYSRVISFVCILVLSARSTTLCMKFVDILRGFRILACNFFVFWLS